MKLTKHAVQRYSARTAKDLFTAETALKDALTRAKEVSYDVASRVYGFPIVRHDKKQTYFVWHDATINEDVCAIVAPDKAVKTVITKGVYSWCNKNLKVRNERNTYDETCWESDDECTN